MIVTQTPLRISFAGGGTDFREYYQANEGGAVISTTIDKYIFVIVKERFDNKIRVGYSTTEMVDSVKELKHELVRESLRKVGINKGIEISTMADVPSTGSGLGSSSSVTVGVLNALYLYKGQTQTAEILAKQASKIEIDIVGKLIGKQDQYAAAYGNMNILRFKTNEEVEVEPVKIDSDLKRRLEENLMLFYTGLRRKSSDILIEQKSEIHNRVNILNKMKGIVSKIHKCLLDGTLDDFGRLLHEGWMYKRELASKISNPEIDNMYRRALEAGALGGKIVGAGGGGFLLLYCSFEKQEKLRKALDNFRELPFRFERDGSKVIFNIRRGR